jgi:hypothetical protein
MNNGPENGQQINNLQFITPYRITYSHEAACGGDDGESLSTVHIGICSREKQIPRKIWSLPMHDTRFFTAVQMHLPSEIDTV